MRIRLALPEEAETCWTIRNQAIRHGCRHSYDAAIIAAWTPEQMPASYRCAIAEHPFFVAECPDNRLAATGFLDLSTASVEAVFTLPHYSGQGLGSLIMDAIKREARERGFDQLTLSSTPNARSFYEKQGFTLVRESRYSSALAQAELRCLEMLLTLR
ncbi:GNAT family N-acetyltransferase [Pantoea sp. KPR_PJ]|uniref:GNAT family N-acetyltransferase n=1 Tax=Pantoea sp. KPR_PJ TaxID=2738375 RepID=UPI0035294DD4